MTRTKSVKKRTGFSKYIRGPLVHAPASPKGGGHDSLRTPQPGPGKDASPEPGPLPPRTKPSKSAFVPPAETPTECAACGQDSDFQRRQAVKICDVESENRQLKFDLESVQSINERKDARIRELEATLRFIATEWDLKPSIKELRSRAKAALARSEEKP